MRRCAVLSTGPVIRTMASLIHTTTAAFVIVTSTAKPVPDVVLSWQEGWLQLPGGVAPRINAGLPVSRPS